MKEINEFKGNYEFLSNFYPSKFYIDGKEYATVEHAYQSFKTEDKIEAEKIRNASTAREAKKLGRNVKNLTKTWDAIKVQIMKDLVFEKFRQNVNLLQKLIDTGDCTLIEGNYWKDNFWGVYNGKGQNQLGKILMEVRELFRKNNTKPKKQNIFGLFDGNSFLRAYSKESHAKGARTQRRLPNAKIIEFAPVEA